MCADWVLDWQPVHLLEEHHEFRLVFGDEKLRQSANHWRQQVLEETLSVNLEMLVTCFFGDEGVRIHDCCQDEFFVIRSFTSNIF